MEFIFGKDYGFPILEDAKDACKRLLAKGYHFWTPFVQSQEESKAV